MLAAVAEASPLHYVSPRYFNVAGSDSGGRIGQATPNATLLIKVACEAAVGKRAEVAIFGTDYPAPDGTGVRDYIHVEDLAAAHLDALQYLRAGGGSTTLNVGYGHGYSVRQVLASVERVSGKPLKVREEPRRPGDPPALVARAERIRRELGWKPRLDDLDTIVRTGLLYQVLADPPLLELYRTQDELLSATREQLRLHAATDTAQTLEQLGGLQRNIRFTVMSTPPSSGAAAASDLSSRFAQLSALVERVAQQSNAQVDSEVAALEAQTLHARNRLLWQAAPLLPLALVAVFVLTLGVGRPLRQLDRAISELGQGAFTNPIAVAGPHDLERLR